MNLNTFKKLLGYSESGNRYTIVFRDSKGNEYLGKYQFGNSAIKDVANKLKIPVPSKAEFLSNPELQEKFFDCLVAINLSNIKNSKLDSYVGLNITGKNKYKKTATINIYGLLAGVHLGGLGGLKKLLINNIDSKDELGTYISDYVAKFSDLTKNEIDVSSLILPVSLILITLLMI